MAKKQYLDLTGLTTYNEQIKSYIDAGDAATSTKLTSGTIVVKEAQHATTADSATAANSAITATSATSATMATQDGNGKVISSTYETKADAAAKLAEAKTYADDVIENHRAYSSMTFKNFISTYAGDQLEGVEDAKIEADYYNAGVKFVAGSGLINFTTDVAEDTVTIDILADPVGSAEAALDDAKSYTDTKTASTLSSAKTYADSAASTAATKVKNDLLNGAGTAYDTLKELGDLIDDNKDAIDVLEDVAAGKADKATTLAGYGITNAYTKGEVDSALSGKANSSHGTHVTYDSTNKPKMDGTAAFGTSGSVARADHVHPTDTSRAAKSDFDSHVADAVKHITSTERTNWGAAYTHSQAAHAPSNAQPNQNAFSNVKVGSTTVAADTTTDTIEFAGTNVTITPDATNDKVTFAVADGTTSAKGVVQLTNSTSSTSTTTAATPSSVKSAYDLANTAKTNAATAQSTADGAATTASEAKSAAAANTQSITAHTSSINTHTSQISALQGLVGDGVEAIPEASITSLFNA